MKTNYNYRKEVPFKDVKKLLQIHYNALKNEEDDRVIIVTGDTGSGKSNFVKHLFDMWYTEILGKKPNKDLLQYFCYGTKDWSTALKKIYDEEIKFNMLYNDEAVNILYYRDSTTKGAKLIKKNFNIIRYLNTYHLLTIPNCHELDAEVVRNRVMGMFYLSKYKGRRVASYFTQKDLLQIIADIKDTIAQKAHQRDKIPRVTDTKSFDNRMFYCYPPLYTGWVDDSYMDGKHEQAGEAVGNLYDHYNPNESKNEKAMVASNQYLQLTLKAKKLVSEGLNITRACKEIGISTNTYYKYEDHEENIT